MRRFITLLISIVFIVLACDAQKLTVESMAMDPFDRTASMNQVLDLNNNACGLVKVQLAAQGAEFRGNVIPPVKHEASQYLVYLTEGTKMLNVQCPGYLPMMVYFRDYGIQKIESKVTYVLTLSMPQAPQKEELQYLIVNITPKNATLFVDDNLQVVQNGMVALRFPKGSSHTYRADAVGYETERGTVEIGEGRKTVNVVLKRSSSQSAAATSSLDVNYQPFNSEVWLDGRRLGVSPDVFRDIPVGTHNVEIRSNGLQTARVTVNIVSGETAQLNGQLTSPQPSPNGEGAQTTSWANSSIPVYSANNSNNADAIIANLINNMVYVEGGSFMMGNDKKHDKEADSDEKPIHQVTLSAFSIGKYEVTQAEWEAVMGNNPSNFKGSDRPVENVSWNDCQEFISKLNAKTGRNFRLPTEAEWEYAARGGSKSQGYKYAGSNNLNDVAWFTDNSGKETHPVGKKQPNELGLYDMSGNVWEWCQDWYSSKFYKTSNQTNPVGPSKGSGRVIRGGSWGNDARNCRASFRNYCAPGSRLIFLGLRLAL